MQVLAIDYLWKSTMSFGTNIQYPLKVFMHFPAAKSSKSLGFNVYGLNGIILQYQGILLTDKSITKHLIDGLHEMRQ